MATTVAKSGSPVDNDNGRILGAGNVTGNKFSALTLATNAFGTQPVPTMAVSPAQSGDLGTLKPLSAGVFASMKKGQYVGKVMGTYISQVSNTLFQAPSAQYPANESVHVGRGNRAYGVTSWNYVTGRPTFDSNIKGSGFNYWNASGTGARITTEPQPTKNVPGKVTYMINGVRPTLGTYKATFEG